MAYMTDETMDEFAQWQHDSAWEAPEATDSEVVTESDIFDCIHDDCDRFDYTNFTVWECRNCGNVGEWGKAS